MKKISRVSGFSLIELIIVIVIIGILAVVAIPNLLSARRAANEGSAISSLRTLHGAQSTYFTSKGVGTFAGTVASTGDTNGLNLLGSAQLIDPALAGGTKNGYNFVGATSLPTATSTGTFFFSANPVTGTGITKSGTRRFNTDTTGIIRYDDVNLTTPFDSTTITSVSGI